MTSPSAGVPAQARSERISLRRALGLIFMSMILPGSAQVAAGNKKVGRLALRVWLILVLLVLAFGVLFLVNKGWAIGLYASPITLWVLAVAALVIGGGWTLLMLDTLRLARLGRLRPGHRPFVGGLALLLALVMGFTSWTAFGAFRSQAGAFGSFFQGGGTSEKHGGRINVLLLGGDAGAGREGLRPDSMTVASVDADTGRTVLISLPRNMEGVPIPESNPLHALYPDGYRCKDESCMLNALYTLAWDKKSLFPNDSNPGVTTTQQVIEEITGLKINYYALVDMGAFQDLIDAVGGIYLNIPYDVPLSAEGYYPVRYLPAGENVYLDGATALEFARSRNKSSDYNRMIRQKCVMQAMLKQLNPTTVLTKFQEIMDAGKNVVSTSVPSSDIGMLLDLATKAKALPIASLSLTPPLVDVVHPDFAAIKTMVSDSLAASKALDDNPQPSAEPSSAAPAPAPESSSAAPQPTGKASSAKASAAKSTASPTAYQAGETSDLDQVCAVAG